MRYAFIVTNNIAILEQAKISILNETSSFQNYKPSARNNGGSGVILTPDFHDLTAQNELREASMTGHIFTNHGSTILWLVRTFCYTQTELNKICSCVLKCI